MSLSVFRRYNNIGDGLVEFSALKAGGFDPVFQNQHYAYAFSLEMLALGGLIILLPDSEADEANEYLTSIKSEPLDDYDPLPEKKYGQWVKASFVGGLSGLLPMLFLPILFLPSFWLLIAGVILVLIDNALSRICGISLLIIAPILLHARYIALPRMRMKHVS